MSTTTITSPPLDSQFRDGPILPSIRQIPTASWPSVLDGSTIPAVPYLSLNKVYFTKKILKETVERYNPNTLQHETAQVWEIPFSVDVNEPVTELTQRIQAVMTHKKIYKHWDINMNTFLITASQVTSEWDTIP
jgi:hypothetical protein